MLRGCRERAVQSNEAKRRKRRNSVRQVKSGQDRVRQKRRDRKGQNMRDVLGEHAVRVSEAEVEVGFLDFALTSIMTLTVSKY